MHSLSDLTDGHFNDLAEITADKITDYFRQKLGRPDLEIPVGNPAPMFDKDGNPVLKSDGSQLCLPYTHACLLVHDIMQNAGQNDKTRTSEITNLPVFFWRSTDVYVVTADDHVPVGQRSNFNKNAPGLCLFTAAGFAKVVDDKAEPALDSAQRELKEETGLTKDNAGFINFKLMGRDFDNGINRYPIDTNAGTIEGRVPTFAEKWVVRSNLTAAELLTRMSSNGESLGFMALPVDRLEELMTTGSTATVSYAPAQSVLEKMLYQNGSGNLADRVTNGISIAALRNELSYVNRPQDYQATDTSLAVQDNRVDTMQGKLGTLIQVQVAPEDFSYGAVTITPLEFMQEAAISVGALPKRHIELPPSFIRPQP